LKVRFADRQITGRVNQVLISVDDSGPGIDPSADRLFNPFFTTKQGGMGMGLSVCKSIVEAHGGQLTVVPGMLGGASFRILLPYVGNDDS
jgi:signal transduction histidine kinase